MGQELVVEVLEAINIPQNLRNWKKLKAKPYITASLGTQEHHTEVDPEGERGSTSCRWKSFRVALPQDASPDQLLVRLNFSRTLKPDKQVASVQIPLALFKDRDAQKKLLSYPMVFTKEKDAARVQGIEIMLRIRAYIEKTSPSACHHTPDGHGRRLARTVAEVIAAGFTLASTIIGAVVLGNDE